MVKLVFALFLLCGVSAAVMAQDTASSAPASEKSANEAVAPAGMDEQGAGTMKADEGTANNAAAPAEDTTSAAPAN